MTTYLFAVKYKEKGENQYATFHTKQCSVEADDRYTALRKVISIYESRERVIGSIKFKTTSNRLRHSM